MLGMHNDTKAGICVREKVCTDLPLIVKALTRIIHHGYSPNMRNNDIALIPLDVKVYYTGK